MSLILLGWELHALYHCTMCTRHPDLVSLDFYAIPFEFLHLLVSSHFQTDLITILNLLIILLQVSSNAMSRKKYYVVGSLDYSCICMYMYTEKCISTWACGIGGLLVNTVY